MKQCNIHDQVCLYIGMYDKGLYEDCNLLDCMLLLCHVRVSDESTLYSCLNIKELLARTNLAKWLSVRF